MAKNENKTLVAILLALPILIGGYILWKKKKDEAEEGKKNNGGVSGGSSDSSTGGFAPSGGSSSASAFPLKKGSKGSKVWELQNAILSYNASLLPKYGADSDFGSETEAAVYSLLGKRTVDSQSDIDRIKNMAKTPISGGQNTSNSASQLIIKSLQAKQNPKVTLIRDSYVLIGKYDPYLIGGGNKFEFNPVYVLKNVGFSFSPTRYSVNSKSGYVDMGDFLGNAISVNPNDIKVS